MNVSRFNPSATCPQSFAEAMAKVSSLSNLIAAGTKENAVRAELAEMNLKPLVFRNGIIV